MLTRWRDLERSLAAFDRLRRTMDGSLGAEGLSHPFSSDAWPRMTLQDAGEELVLLAEIPGMTEKEVELTANRTMLSVRGQRKVEAPAGYRPHRRERQAYEFARSLSLPTAIDPDKVSAQMRNGILAVRMAKAAEARPRQISIQAS